MLCFIYYVDTGPEYSNVHIYTYMYTLGLKERRGLFGKRTGISRNQGQNRAIGGNIINTMKDICGKYNQTVVFTMNIC